MVAKSEVDAGAPDYWSQVWGPVRKFGQQVADLFAPNSEASAAADAYEISVELPGVADKDISIEIHDRRLTVSGEKRSVQTVEGRHYYFSERTYGGFRRTFQLPEDADVDMIEAAHKDGLLTIRAPRIASGARAKRIEIQSKPAWNTMAE